MPLISKLVTGGQTGVDRAGLDVALKYHLRIGGWCPRGRLAEDGVIHDRYPLVETPLDEPDQRTRWNIRDSDGTLILAALPLKGGTRLTQETAERTGKPSLVVNPADDHPIGEVLEWIQRNRVCRLNVAGPRESEQPGVYRQAFVLLDELFRCAR